MGFVEEWKRFNWLLTLWFQVEIKQDDVVINNREGWWFTWPYLDIDSQKFVWLGLCSTVEQMALKRIMCVQHDFRKEKKKRFVFRGVVAVVNLMLERRGHKTATEIYSWQVFSVKTVAPTEAFSHFFLVSFLVLQCREEYGFDPDWGLWVFKGERSLNCTYPSSDGKWNWWTRFVSTVCRKR